MTKNNLASAIMFQGTGSDVGKSLVVAGLCRAYAQRGKRVSPFKPQNMSNNAAVTDEGGEIGRAQALQARAAKTPTGVHMNPVLLKPQSEIGSQIIVQGQVFGEAKARDYHKLKPKLLTKVLESFRIVGRGVELVIVEGAGSPAEVNLRAGDIANMGFAEAAGVPVVLVADINRGGVIASLIGTFEVLTEAERRRVKGFVINKFRGDVSLFDDGLKIITAHTGWRCLGVLPFFEDAHLLPQEDAMALDQKSQPVDGKSIKVVVPRLPRIANFDDLDPLKAEPDVAVEFVESGQAIAGDADIVLIPGSKATCSDLVFLKHQGWDIDILAHHRRGGTVIGLCGGYQMLGTQVSDPGGIEGTIPSVDGLGLLDVSTEIQGAKALQKVSGHEISSNIPFSGFEMHIGKTTGPGTKNPWLTIDGSRTEGARSLGGQVYGSYVHGVFANDTFRTRFLEPFRNHQNILIAYEDQIEGILDRLGQHMESHLDMAGIEQIVKSADKEY